MKRRNFFRSLGGFAGTSLFTLPVLNERTVNIAKKLTSFSSDPELAARDEDFWHTVRQAYTVSAGMINLNNGGVSPHPRLVEEKVNRYNALSNEAPGFYMWRILGRTRPTVHQNLARLAGCKADELAVMRNATEALATVIMGLDLKSGDEIVVTEQDYPSVLNALDLRERRHKIKIKKISLPIPLNDPDEVVKLYSDAIGPRTKAMVFCHVIHLTGQIMPAEALCELARKNNIYSIVDGAHSFAQLDFHVPDLDCDFFATSLHKWLCAPFGTGMLYMKKEHIPKVWPLNGYPEGELMLMSKFEHLGTRSLGVELAINDAIRFHEGIGIARKQSRLNYLKKYWTERVADIPRLSFTSIPNAANTCAICSFNLEGWKPLDLHNALLRKYSLYTTALLDVVPGVRVSPQVYTSLNELDTLVKAIHELAETKPPRN
ncbi:MAG: aminotransferase class V-fold PLP-dependent enzyme [Bacteroidota bacterium]